MKITTRAEYQWDGSQYILISEDAYEYRGKIAEAKSSSNFFAPGEAGNQIADPLDLFGGTEKGAANRAKQQLPGQLSDLNELQANIARYDTSGPFGNSSWKVDPTTGRYTQDISLSPSEQNQFNTRNEIANTMLGQVSPQSVSGNAQSYAPQIANEQYAKSQSLTNPVQAQSDANWSAKMANAGISPNSDAYKEAQTQRTSDTNLANTQARQLAIAQSPQLANQQRQQRLAQIASALGSMQINSPAMGGNGIDINGSTAAANQAGINNANMSAANRNAMMNSLAGAMQMAYPS